MQLTKERRGKVSVISLLASELDAGNVSEFREALANVLEDSDRFVLLDLSQVEFVDSSGLGTILSLLRRLIGAGGDLKVCGVDGPVRTLFELVRLHRVMDIFQDCESAIDAFENP